MMYLETVISDMAENSNVLVMLSSKTKYPYDTVIQDSCGNHHAINWLDAIRYNGLEEMFLVKDITVKESSDIVQWTITLLNERGRATDTLCYEANSSACTRAFSRFF